MLHLFLDTNVVIDFVTNRKPFSAAALKIFLAAQRKQCKLYISAQSITTVHYFLSQLLSENETRKMLDTLMKYCVVIAVDQKVLQLSIASPIKDFEDAVQDVCAKSLATLHYIVTRNQKDFKNSSHKIISPNEAMQLIDKK